MPTPPATFDDNPYRPLGVWVVRVVHLDLVSGPVIFLGEEAKNFPETPGPGAIPALSTRTSMPPARSISSDAADPLGWDGNGRRTIRRSGYAANLPYLHDDLAVFVAEYAGGRLGRGFRCLGSSDITRQGRGQERRAKRRYMPT